MTPSTTSDSLRARIDSGDGGDKVDFPDPSAAPLGTDDEAAGTPPTAEDVALAAASELARGPADSPNDTGERRRAGSEEKGIPYWVWGLLAAFALSAIVLALMMES